MSYPVRFKAIFHFIDQGETIRFCHFSLHRDSQKAACSKASPSQRHFTVVQAHAADSHGDSLHV
jgi:hypothetical protein